MSVNPSRAPFAVIPETGDVKLRTPNSDASFHVELGLPVVNVQREGLLVDLESYCSALLEALGVQRTRVSFFEAELCVTVFQGSFELHVVDAFLDRVRHVVEMTGHLGLKSISRHENVVNLKVVMIDAYRHSD